MLPILPFHPNCVTSSRIFFKHHYPVYQEGIGSLTEYYRFEDVKPVLRDLRRMKPKALSVLEQGIVDGSRPDIELQWESQQSSSGVLLGSNRALSVRERMASTLSGVPAKSRRNKFFRDLILQVCIRRWLLGCRCEMPRAAGVSLGTVQKVKAALGNSSDSASERTLITRTDLPNGDLDTIWCFAAEKYVELWGQRWSWYEAPNPIRLNDNSPYYIHFFGLLHYIGEKRGEVINNILYILNTGKDDPVKRLRLANAESACCVSSRTATGSTCELRR